MRICEIHIDAFGKLENFTLTPTENVTLIVGENEYGKSTLLAFIRAMLYGFGPRSTTRGRIFDRKRFAPWNGRAAGGSITLETEGERYRIERFFAPSRAEDQTTLVRESTGDRIDLADTTPGEYLLHMEESTFIQTVYIGQAAVRISATGRDLDELSRRLANLSSGGNETVSVSEIDGILSAAASRIRSPRGAGTLPALEEELTEIRDRLIEAGTLREESETLRLRADECRDRTQALTQTLLHLRGRLSWLHERETARATRLAQTASTEQLILALRDLEERQRKIETERVEDRVRFGRRIVEFRRHRNASLQETRDTEALIEDKQAKIAARERELLTLGVKISEQKRICDRLQKFHIRLFGHDRPGGRYVALFVLAALAGVVSSVVLRDPIHLFSLLVLAVPIYLLIEYRVRRVRMLRELSEMNRVYATHMTVFENETASLYAYQKQMETQIQSNRESDRLLGDMRDERKREIDRKRELLETIAVRRDQYRRRVSQAGSIEGEAEDVGKLRDELEKEASADKEEIERLREAQEKTEGDIAALRIEEGRLRASAESALARIPDVAWLEEREGILRARCEDLRRRLEDLSVARKYLAAAGEDTQHRLAPALNEAAAKYMSLLTGGAYDRLRVDSALEVELKSNGEARYHPLAQYSGGTIDQLYLALRLAVSDLLAEGAEPLPLLLDDPFMQYDDMRAFEAMRLLRTLGEHRQILLFTCHERIRKMYEARDDAG